MEEITMTDEKDAGPLSVNRQDFTLREGIADFINAKPKIKNVTEINEADGSTQGLIRFSVSMKDMGFTKENYGRLRPVIFSRFFANFAGELLVRENIDFFVEKIVSVDDDKYGSIVNGWDYKNFGMKRIGQNFVFSFHISFIRDVVEEDFKKQMKA